MARRISFLSGKGGVGKTNLITNLAVAAAALGGRVLLVDGDVGLSNVDVLLGIVPERDVGDVLDGRCRIDEAIMSGPSGLSVLASPSGRADLAAARVSELSGLIGPILADAWSFDLILVDAGSGIGAPVRALTACCDRALLVTTPEPTSLTDAYATLKVLRRDAPTLPLSLVINQVERSGEGHSVALRLQRAARRFLGTQLELEHEVPQDAHITRAVAAQVPWVTRYPNAPASRAIVKLAGRLLARASRARGAARSEPLRTGNSL